MTSMNPRVAEQETGQGGVMRSVGAVFLGFVAVVALSLGTDEILHVLEVYPPWGQPMPQPRLNLLALVYRDAFAVMGGVLAARFAPRAAMRHAVILGIVGTLIGTIGAIATIPLHLGPAWYPIALAVSALPCSWFGGLLWQRTRKAANP